MRSIQVLTLILSFLTSPFTLASSSGAGHFVGNGGEGVLVDQQIFLRDLYESGLSQNPWIGKDLSPELKLDLNRPSLIRLLGDHQDLFLRKLTDLNQISPHLGRYLLEVLQSYDWVLLPEKLGRINDDHPILDIPDEQRIQIANRLSHTVRISISAWEKMNPSHRVALLLHEGFYSMTRVYCDPELKTESCWQSPRTAKDLTARSFSKDSLETGLPYKLLFEILVPIENQYCPGTQEIRFTFFKGFNKTGAFEALEKISASPRSKEAVSQAISQVCLMKERNPNLHLQLDMTRLGFRIDKWSYKASTGTFQWAAHLISQSPSVTLFNPKIGSLPCEQALLQIYRRWFSGELQTGPSVCQMRP